MSYGYNVKQLRSAIDSSVTLPNVSQPAEADDHFFRGLPEWNPFGTGKRKPALAVNLESIQVRHVEGVSFQTVTYPVVTDISIAGDPLDVTDV